MPDRRGHWIPWSEITGDCEPPEVGAGTLSTDGSLFLFFPLPPFLRKVI